MKFRLAIGALLLIAVGLWSYVATAMLAPIVFDKNQVVAYTGPCDIITCAEAYSVTRAMKASYTGNLFQLVRASDSTTLDVGQTSHIVDMSGIPAFCSKTTCAYSKLYAQINSNDLTPVTATNGGSGSNSGGCAAATGNTCAPLYYVDPENGLPIIDSIYPSQLYSSTGTGITGGSNAISVYWDGRNEGHSACCGIFGPAHAGNAGLTAGTDFLPGFAYGTGSPFNNASSATTQAVNVDIETFMTNGADYSPNTLQNISGMATFSGGGGTNLIKTYVNSATATSSAAPASATTMNVGTTVRLGGGGDLSHVRAIFREGLIANFEISSGNYTSIDSNVSAFYAGRSSACSSTADFGYYYGNSDDNLLSNVAIGSTLIGYGLRQMSASYWGPIADLRDALGTVNTYGPASSGCTIDSAAATFCAANPPCTVPKLYNQATATTNNVGNAHDATLDMTQATVGNQPQAKFSGLNGLPTLVFSGGQSMCTTSNGAGVSYTTLVGFVAKRTGTFTSFNSVLNIGKSTSSFGFSNAANSVYSFVGATTEVLISSSGVSDSAFHSYIYEMRNTGAGNTAIYGDNSSMATGNQAAFWNLNQDAPSANQFCIGETRSGGPNFLTGEIAEVTAGINGVPGATPTQALEATLYAKQHAAWGI